MQGAARGMRRPVVHVAAARNWVMLAAARYAKIEAWVVE
ncbi:hypothetical protein N234_15370 [Ralstonia pickettii DTP0602]|nr:hypothetical protein N234_15370 [Ralstonia pickettii DTP0602]